MVQKQKGAANDPETDISLPLSRPLIRPSHTHPVRDDMSMSTHAQLGINT